MAISSKLEWTDYLQAQYLHMRPHPVIRIGQYVLVAIFLVVVAGNAIFSLQSGDQALFWVALAPILIVAIILVLYYRVFLPMRVRRIYTQQKELSAPMEHEIAPEGLVTNSLHGHTTRPWADFLKWKEDKDLILLYISEIAFVILPKRFLTSEQVEAIKAHLAENKVGDASSLGTGSVVRFVIYGVLLVAMAVMFYMSFRSAMP